MEELNVKTEGSNCEWITEVEEWQRDNRDSSSRSQNSVQALRLRGRSPFIHRSSSVDLQDPLIPPLGAHPSSPPLHSGDEMELPGLTGSSMRTTLHK
ncbi:hypothetical protein J5N97_024591 [Dioscorea zingiberensis]|uniref:Uncharacterized protein n=1 Tax=Dioscorea zingiberensis TaxID=325984 RepID=A0A9D5C7A0_9LILI|nr:hypothetical protein J5N97_024591 [Dioscorea zingiberensis]